MYNILDNLPVGEKDKADHIAALKLLPLDNVHLWCFDHLYNTLTILDQKAASLLQFNSIITAVFTVLFTSAGGGLFSLSVNCLGLSLSMLSSLYLLSIIWVHWSSSNDFKDRDNHIIRLLEVRLERTIRYRRAWQYAVLSFLSLIISFASYAYFYLLNNEHVAQ